MSLLSHSGRHNRVRVFPIDEVTTVSEEVEPAEGGLTPRAVNTIWKAVQAHYRTGLYPAVSFCLRRHGKVVLNRSIGHATGNRPGELDRPTLATPDTLFNLFSASKAITAMVVHLLNERGLVHLDDPLVEYIPEFGQRGKESTTLRQILVHTAGIPSVPGEHVDLDLLLDLDRIVKLLCETKPVWPPGRRLAYHALTGGWVIAEVVRRVTGRPIEVFFEEEIARPLGMRDLTYGVAQESLHRVAENVLTGPLPRFPVSLGIKRALGVPFQDAVAFSNDPRFLTSVIPSGNIHATALEASRFYQLLLDDGVQDGTRIYQRRTIRRAVGEQTYLELDLTLLLPMRYGLGLMLGGDHVSMYGRRSPRAFGHVGFTNVITYADPDRDIAVALLNSGKPFFTLNGLYRWIGVMSTIARVCPRMV